MKNIFTFLIASTILFSCTQTEELKNQQVLSDSIKKTLPGMYKSITAFSKVPDFSNGSDTLLSLELNNILNADQNTRKSYKDVLDIYGAESKEMKRLESECRQNDSINLIKVTDIIDKRGWLGVDAVGYNGNLALFLVIQHAEIKIQEKYLPIMRKAVKDGKAEASALALLEDRILIRHGKKQIYGSQLEMDKNTGKYILSAIEDEPNVNKRRASVGLEPLEEYVKQWDIEYILPTK